MSEEGRVEAAETVEAPKRIFISLASLLQALKDGAGSYYPNFSGDPAQFSLVEYVRAQPPTADVKAVAREIVREWSEHDMNEHYNSDYLRDEFGAGNLEARITAALSTAKQQGRDERREKDARLAETAFKEFQTGYNAGKWIAEAIRSNQ